MKILNALFIASLIIFSRNAIGAQGNTTPYVSIPDKPVSKAQAIEVAKELQKMCARILSLIPLLSPSEKTWLEGEKKSSSGDRIMNLDASPEFARDVLHLHFKECVDFSGIAANSPTARARAIGWAALVSRFTVTTPSDIENFGKRSGIEELHKATVDFSLWEMENTSNIMDSLVIPYIVQSK
jgi:hypothetical protein